MVNFGVMEVSDPAMVGLAPLVGRGSGMVLREWITVFATAVFFPVGQEMGEFIFSCGYSSCIFSPYKLV